MVDKKRRYQVEDAAAAIASAASLLEEALGRCNVFTMALQVMIGTSGWKGMEGKNIFVILKELEAEDE